MDYTTLVAAETVEGSIKYAVRHSLVPSDTILDLAEALIYSRLKVREMKALHAAQTLAAAASTITLPDGFLEPISLWLDRDYRSKIVFLDEEHFEERVGRDINGDLYEGTPSMATFDGTTIYLDVKADIQYYYRMWYYKQPEALSGTNLTNFLTNRYPNILDAICKYYAYRHRRMQGDADSWLQLGLAAIDLANAQYDQAQQSIQTEMFWRQPA